MIESDVLLGLIITPLVLLPLIYVYYLQVRKYRRNTPYLLSVILTIVFAFVLSLFGLLLESGSYASGPITFTATLAIPIIPFFLYMHFQSLVTIKPPLKRFTLFLSLTLVIIILQVPQYYGLIDPSDPSHKSYYALIYSASFIQSVVLLRFCMKIAYRNYNKSQNLPTLFELIAVGLLAFSWPITALGAYFDVVYPDIGANLALILSVLGIITGMGGFLIFTINYFRNLDYLYSVPVDIHAIVIYNTSGIPMYKKKLGSGTNISEELFSGAFTAISSVLQEAISDDVLLKHIDLGLYNVFFGHIEDTGTLALVSDEASAFFISSIDLFIRNIPDQLQDLLKHGYEINDELINKMDNYLISMFPYIKI